MAGSMGVQGCPVHLSQKEVRPREDAPADAVSTPDLLPSRPPQGPTGLQATGQNPDPEFGAVGGVRGHPIPD